MNVGLGTASFGTTISQHMCEALIEKYLSLGGTHIDTANNYAFWVEGCSGRESETAIGKWISKSATPRSQYLLGSKVGAFPHANNEFEGLAKETILNAVDESLERLRTNYLDILYLHVPDKKTPISETLAALDRLIHLGKIKTYGLSNYDTDDLQKLNKALRRQPYIPKPSYAQYRHSLLRPVSPDAFGIQKTFTDDIITALNQINPKIQLVGFSVLLDGLYEQPTIPQTSPYFSPENQLMLEQLRSMAMHTGHSASALMIQKMAKSRIFPLTMTSDLRRLEKNLSLVSKNK